MEFKIQGEFITLMQLLKAATVVESGGMAKAVIQEGNVLVNNQVETQNRKKLYPGDVVEWEEFRIEIS